MKLNNIISAILMAGAMVASQQAGAAIIYTGTIAGWQAFGGDGVILDLDGDANFTFVASNLAGTIPVTITEVETPAGVDKYAVSVGDIATPLTNGTFIDYTIDSLSNEYFLGAKVDADADIGSQTNVLKQITGDANANLNAVNGIPQTVGFTPGVVFSIGVHDVFTVTQPTLNSATNSFDLGTVPEPVSLSLFGIGLLGMVASRRRSA